MIKSKNDDIFPNTKTVYGPVASRRFGMSLGIDPIFTTSTCSFNCIYCQLGNIENVTMERKIYVDTNKVISDMRAFLAENKQFDVITFSGSGEPTLALNLKEISQKIKEMAPGKELLLLTNSTLLNQPTIYDDLIYFDRIIAKLDGDSTNLMNKVNRAHEKVTFESIIDGIKNLKKHFKGKVEIQTMLFRMLPEDELNKFAVLLKDLNPDVIQLNTPTRPYPLTWHRENRGNHLGIFDYDVRNLVHMNEVEAGILEKKLRELTQIEVISVYPHKK